MTNTFTFFMDDTIVVVQARVGKEFPDMGPSEREIKFIRVSGPAQERADVEWGSLVHFYTQGTRSEIGVLWVIC